MILFSVHFIVAQGPVNVQAGVIFLRESQESFSGPQCYMIKDLARKLQFVTSTWDSLATPLGAGHHAILFAATFQAEIILYHRFWPQPVCPGWFPGWFITPPPLLVSRPPPLLNRPCTFCWKGWLAHHKMLCSSRCCTILRKGANSSTVSSCMSDGT